MKVAVAKYAIQAPADFDAFAARIEALLREARDAGARLAVLPEYLALELAATFPPAVQGDLHASLAAIQALRAPWLALFSRLAREFDLYVVAGSFLLDVGGGRYRNRSDWFAPDGSHRFQDKLALTAFEKDAGVIEPGDALKVFGIDGHRAGIAVCYDIEFPLPVRAQVEAGARLIVSPSCTDTEAGATRVRVGCMARALEGRCFVAQSVTAGVAEWSAALDVNTGEAALYAPMDRDLPADGFLARTAGGEVWAIAELDFDALEASRAHAQVANDRDWPAQLRPAFAAARLDADRDPPAGDAPAAGPQPVGTQSVNGG
ncbi:carbon-nitrogen hydrolase family protein [Coralloluteibacterium stylophorae]|uniref:Carbon-nitrogen hydrolase family protein n=1 Tax=Coralloluteibacterium stylophorae TaxID=1776034 RepID=A0A8J7VTY6_9GAMM|nr:carbon-nitrogen hydrolase family protein [Coralloluteibacterium stylophorae]MBS7458687.1 carbon-nitrogen hydrolase family protein [Coralloluteibacterium stylophorae]